MNVHTLPDLKRMRALSDRVRTSSDDQVADLLATDDGKWLFADAGPYLDADVLRRHATVLASALDEGVFWTLLGVTPERVGGSHG